MNSNMLSTAFRFVYKNNNAFSQNPLKFGCQQSNLLKLNQLKSDTVSFCARKDFNKMMLNLNSDCFPSDGLREFMLRTLKDPNNDKNIVELHKFYYSKLKDCKTLEEAKQMYPEFEQVIDAKDIDIEQLAPQSVFRRIKNNKIKNAKLETLSLEFLKTYYADLIPPTKKSMYFDLSQTVIRRILPGLNIQMNDKYLSCLHGCIHSEISSKTMTKLHQNSEFEKMVFEKNSETMKKRYQNPEFKKRMEVLYKARKLANKIHPCAHRVRSEVAKEFPYLAELLAKQKAGKTNEIDEAYIKSYIIEVNKRYPNLCSEIGELETKILENWGFYEKDENAKDVEELIELANKALENECFGE